MKKLTIIAASMLLLASCANQGGNNAEQKDSLAKEEISQAKEENVDYFKNFLDESDVYAKDDKYSNKDFYTYEEDGKRFFTLTEASDLEQHWGIGGPLVQSSENPNKYTFTAKDDFNGFKDEHTGTLEFVKKANGVEIVFSNLNKVAEEYFPEALGYHEKTEEDRIFQLSEWFAFGTWNSDEVYMELDLMNKNQDEEFPLGKIDFSTIERTDIHKIEKVIKWDTKNRKVVVEAICSRNDEKSTFEIEYHEDETGKVTVLEANGSDCFAKKGNSYKVTLAYPEGF